MTFPEYTPAALSTCMDSCRNIAYPTFGAIEELGELVTKLLRVISTNDASQLHHSAVIVLDQMSGVAQGAQHISKAVRHGSVEPPIVIDNMKLTPDTQESLKSEIGDVLWNLNLLCHQLGFTLDDASAYNLQKLAKRKRDQTIDGNGDTTRTNL